MRAYQVLLNGGSATARPGAARRPTKLFALGLAICLILAGVAWFAIERPREEIASNKEMTSKQVTAAHGDAMPSIAVLPFQNLGGDPKEDYFSDGITNDIIADLLNAPFEDVANAQITPNILYVHGLALVGEDRIAGDHEQIVEAGKIGDDVDRDAVAEGRGGERRAAARCPPRRSARPTRRSLDLSVGREIPCPQSCNRHRVIRAQRNMPYAMRAICG